MFVHRFSGIEGRDGNPLNEVRILCNSILLNKGKLQVDKSTSSRGGRTPPSPDSICHRKGLLKLQVGDEVRLTEADFVRLSKGFFAEIEKKYS